MLHNWQYYSFMCFIFILREKSNTTGNKNGKREKIKQVKINAFASELLVQCIASLYLYGGLGREQPLLTSDLFFLINDIKSTPSCHDCVVKNTLSTSYPSLGFIFLVWFEIWAARRRRLTISHPIFPNLNSNSEIPKQCVRLYINLKIQPPPPSLLILAMHDIKINLIRHNSSVSCSKEP